MVWCDSLALVASTAAISGAVTALAAWQLLPKYLAQQPQRRQQPVTASGQLGASTVTTTAVQKRPDPYDTRPKSTYLSWDDYFMAVAFLSAERSKDPNKQVGACIVNDDNIILSIGYNGFPRGCADSKLPWSKKAASGSILDTKYPYVVHAEANALLNKNQAHVGGARIYVTLFPCNECAKLLIQAGIREVVYHEAKLEPTGKRPATMEQAAAADTAEDDAAAAARNGDDSSCNSSSTSDSSSADCSCSSHSQPQQQQQQQDLQKQKSFSVGASSDLDASYIASQRMLTLAGVKLRQHALKRTVQLPPGGAS